MFVCYIMISVQLYTRKCYQLSVLVRKLQEYILITELCATVQGAEGTECIFVAKELDQGEALNGTEVRGGSVHVLGNVDILEDTEALELVSKLVNRDVSWEVTSDECSNTLYNLLLHLEFSSNLLVILLELLGLLFG